ncbi:hypothetical protein V6N13_123521 [Hibiscus sabdariffa]
MRVVVKMVTGQSPSSCVYRNQGYNYEQGERSGNKGGEISNKQVERNNPENAEQRRENASTELKSQNNDLDMSSMLNEGKRKKIAGHVENEDLWKYRRCLVGKMASVCNLSNVMSRLDTWGLITVKRMGSERNRTLGDSSSVFSRRRSSEKGSENINSLGDDSLMHSLLERRKLKMDVQLCDKILSAERIVIEEKECTADVVVKEERWAAVAKERLNDEDNDVGRGVEVELGENTGPVNGIQDNVSDQTLDDLRCMGFQLRESNSEYIELSNSNGSYCGGKSCRHEFVVSDKLTLKRGGD